MLILIFLTSVLPFTIATFVLLCAGIVVAARSGYPDESVKPAPGSRWPRLTLRSIMAMIRGPDRSGADRSIPESHERRRGQA